MKATLYTTASSYGKGQEQGIILRMEESAVRKRLQLGGSFMICCKCGKELEADSMFCRFCGEKLPGTTVSEPGMWEKAIAAGKSMTRKHFILIAVVAIAVRVLFTVFGGPPADEVCVQKGEDLLEQRKYDAALSEYEKAIRLNPKNVATYIGRAKVYYIKDDCESAISSATEAINLQPESARAYHVRAWAQESQKNFDSAIADMDQVIALTGKNRWHISRGDIFRNRGDYKQALADYDKGLEDPGASDSLKKSAFLGRGKIYMKQHHFEKAIENFTKVIELKPEEHKNYYYRGNCYYDLQEYEEALADFTKAIELNPSDKFYYICCSKTLDKLGRYDEAFIVLEKGVTCREREKNTPRRLRKIPDTI